MIEFNESSGRGIREVDVFTAADALLAEGKRPTIERVRLKIGRGSPNTVSPMLERWFASLGERVVGVKPVAGKSAGNDSDGMPTSVRNAARLLWETARREAEEVQRTALESAQADLRVREEALAAARDALAQREDAFAQARTSLDAALASSQQARETLERQLRDHAIEAHRVRMGLEDEIKRLTALLSQAAAVQEDMRGAHAGALDVKDADLRRAEERHAAQERRMLEEVDRARQATKQAEAGFAKEQQQRLQSEEAAAQALEAGRQRLREAREMAQHMERELRERLAKQTGLLARTESEGSALRQRLEGLERQLAEEKKSHEDTRGLLAGALAVRSANKPPRKSAVRQGKGALPPSGEGGFATG